MMKTNFPKKKNNAEVKSNVWLKFVKIVDYLILRIWRANDLNVVVIPM